MKNLFRNTFECIGGQTSVKVSHREKRRILKLCRRLHMGPPQVVGYSIRLLSWVSEEAEEGRHFGSIDPVNKIAREVQLPGFSSSLAGREVAAQGA